MTFEEKAQDIILTYTYSDEDGDGNVCEGADIDGLQQAIVAALVAARAAALEEAAQVAESFIPSGFTGAGKLGNSFAVARDDRARSIAAAIRALK